MLCRDASVRAGDGVWMGGIWDRKEKDCGVGESSSSSLSSSDEEKIGGGREGSGVALLAVVVEAIWEGGVCGEKFWGAVGATKD